MVNRERAEGRWVAGGQHAPPEPLVAERELRVPHRAPSERGVAGLYRRYGWRLYAIPVLLAVTVLVVVRALQPSGENGSVPAAAGAPAPTTPNVSEHGPGLTLLTGNTAKLPEGGKYTDHGEGTWHVVPGTSKKVGTGGKLVTYSVLVEDGIPPAEYGGDGGFAKLVQATLSDPRSWTGSGEVTMQRVDKSTPGQPDIQVALTTPDTVHRVCGDKIHYESSCFLPSTDKVYINLARWVRGARAFKGDIGTYREYAINHEVGHALGNGHVGCPKDGGLAPVMMQQTFGVSDNFVYRINQRMPRNADAVPRDGKVCTPNAWPMLGEK